MVFAAEMLFRESNCGTICGTIKLIFDSFVKFNWFNETLGVVSPKYIYI